jgi:hypothetical protein
MQLVRHHADIVLLDVSHRKLYPWTSAMPQIAALSTSIE